MSTLATIQRLQRWRNGVPCLPFVEFRTRDSDVFFEIAQWGWSEDPGEAYLFLEKNLPAERSADDWKHCAEAHVERLQCAGEVCRLVICDHFAADGQERALKEQSRYEQVAVPAPRRPARRRPRKKSAGVPSEVVYAETQRRLGENE